MKSDTHHDQEAIRNTTRSDVELRVSTKSSRTSSQKWDQAPSEGGDLAQTATGNARRTRMLGGQLGAVSSKRKVAQNSKVGWWILGTLIVLIAFALLIPTPNSNDNELAVSNEGFPLDTPESDTMDQDSRVDELTVNPTEDEISFIRQDDLGRVQAYAEEERIATAVQEFLAIAQELENSGRTHSPEGENAAELYQKILELQPSNTEATQGINRVLAALLSSANTALSVGNTAVAQDDLSIMQAIDPENHQTTSLQEALDQYHSEQAERATNITELIRAAEASLSEGYVLAPPRTNAIFYYQQVLSIEPKNVVALDGVNRIAGQQLQLANEAILESDLEEAISRLNTVAMLTPDNPALTLLRTQIDTLSATAKTAAPTIPEIAEPNRNTTDPAVVDIAVEPEQASNTQTGIDQTWGAIDVTVVETQITAETQAPTLATIEADMATGLQHYYHGRYDEAYSILKPLADRGVARAQFRFAVMLQLGRGSSKNAKAAEDLFRRSLPSIRASAEAGEEWAQADLASLYEDGMVVAQNLEQAFSWYLRAAEQGYSGAQTNLGTMYYYGQGVERNRDKAIEWYRAAADQGDLVARENLSKIGVR